MFQRFAFAIRSDRFPATTDHFDSSEWGKFKSKHVFQDRNTDNFCSTATCSDEIARDLRAEFNKICCSVDCNVFESSSKRRLTGVAEAFP
jgi:hypothetical protein